MVMLAIPLVVAAGMGSIGAYYLGNALDEKKRFKRMAIWLAEFYETQAIDPFEILENVMRERFPIVVYDLMTYATEAFPMAEEEIKKTMGCAKPTIPFWYRGVLIDMCDTKTLHSLCFWVFNTSPWGKTLLLVWYHYLCETLKADQEFARFLDRKGIIAEWTRFLEKTKDYGFSKEQLATMHKLPEYKL